MPQNRRTDALLDLTPEDVYELAAGHKFFRRTSTPPPDLRQAWLAIGQPLTAEHAARLPGSRPHVWWVYVAPERRRQVDSGPTHTMLAIGSRVVQKFFYGAPGTHSAADQNCVFECQCAFLIRTGLLLEAEKRLFESPAWVCAACKYQGFGQPHLTFDEVKAWFEALKT